MYLCHEALNNVIKHAQATRLYCSLAAEDGWLVLGFRDNGRGFQAEAQRKSHGGLVNMLTRAQRVGGSVKLHSAPDQGTEMVIRLPLEHDTATTG